MTTELTLARLAKVSAMLLLFETQLTGFVVMSDARLPISPESPQFVFTWDGVAPSFTGQSKANYAGGIYADMTNEEVAKALLDKSANEWGAVYGTYLEFKVDTTAGVKADATDGINAIVVEDFAGLTTSGYTLPTASPDAPYYSKVVTDCDIHLNKGDLTSLEAFNQTAAHEMGHCVGLGHPHTNYDALMSYARDFPSPELGQDDMAGLLFLYRDPAKYSGEVKNLVAVPCGTIGTGHSTAGVVLMLLFACPLVACGLPRAAVAGRHRRQSAAEVNKRSS